MAVQVTLHFTNEEWEKLNKNAKFVSRREEEDFNPSDWFGGNMDDAFDGGWDDGYDSALAEVAKGILAEVQVEFI